MNSSALPSFWAAYRSLPESVRRQAQKAYRLWAQNPFHPSLHFKCINEREDIWSVRVSLDFRALGIRAGDVVTWFWIGSHSDYDHFFS